MGKKSPAPPPAPDPAATAQAQAGANLETARATAALNRVNQYTPTGSITWRNVGAEDLERRLTQRYEDYQAGRYQPNYGNDRFGAPIQEGFIPDVERRRLQDEMGGQRDVWESVTTLSPNQQRLLDLSERAQITYGDAANKQLQQAQDSLSRPIDFTGLPGLSDAATNRQAAADAMYGRIAPQQEQQRAALDARLRNQGLTPGSEAWANAWREYGMQENDLRLAVDAQAGSEMNRVYGTEAANRQRALEELIAQRQMPVNEASALLTGQMLSPPQFNPTPQVGVAPTDYLGAVGMNQAAQNQAYQGRVAAQQGNNAAAAGAATAAISAAAIIA